VRAYLFNINRCADDLDVIERELATLGDNLAIKSDHGTSVVIETIPVTALLVRIEIHTSELSFVNFNGSGGRFMDVSALAFNVASLISSTRLCSLRSSWWLPLEFVKISTPSKPIKI
jgi:hypothetical protein